ncbi:MAG: ABC transporter permease subunit [Syntrophomonadaceae bacterium]|nr:ABC transporter permease subunit [Syntrophomonadaceae bacterium]MDD3023413.1 ABC transporter permease subunit [Syntrophomonadaceae bacterium]
MSYTLFKTTLKKNWVLLIIFFAVLTMYLGIMVSMYDPNEIETLISMLRLFPEDLMEAMGFSGLVTDLTGYLASWLYGLLMFGFPMVYCIILGNKLVAKLVDNGSFAYLLSTPNSRVKIIVTQGIYALASIAALFAGLFGTGVLICEAMFPGYLDVGAFLSLNFTTMLVNMAVMMISFFFSCLFNDTKMSLGFGSGVPIAFILMNMLGGTSRDAHVLKSFSIYGLYDPLELIRGADIWNINLVYIVTIIVLFVAAVLVFRKKRLPL